MSLFDSFIHGDALTEILLESHHPQALQKLDTADVDALRQQMRAGDSVQGYVIGRVVGSGRGIWVVTQQAILLRDSRRQGAESVALDQVDAFEAVRGRFGHTVRLQAQGRGWSLFGTDRDLARSLHQALQARGIRSSHEDLPALGPMWRHPPAGWVDECLADAKARLQPA